MVEQKTLYILRHAKAAGGADDKVRPLADRGFHEAEAMGKYLADQHIRVDKVFCSSSVRTRQTWQHVLKHYKANPPIDYTDALYVASLNDLLQFVAALPESLNSAMLIGHNPGLHELCIKLVKSGDEKLHDQLAMKFPPGALAAITLDSWDAHGGVLTLFKVPDSL